MAMRFLKSVLHLIFHLVYYHQILLAKLNLHIYYPHGTQGKSGKVNLKIEIALRHGCSPVNLLHIFRASFPKNIYKRLLCTTKMQMRILFIRFENKFKVRLSPSKKIFFICFNDILSKMMKNAFHLLFKNPFCSQSV